MSSSCAGGAGGSDRLVAAARFAMMRPAAAVDRPCARTAVAVCLVTTALLQLHSDRPSDWSWKTADGCKKVISLFAVKQ